ncbi:hypothetical protein PYCC9005_004867 [Savitreella phatthalungensis]
MLVVDGSFEEQIEELALFIDQPAQQTSESAGTEIQAEPSSPLQQNVRSLVEAGKKDAAVQAIVDQVDGLASNASAERDYEAAYNLLIHLTLSLDEPSNVVQVITRDLQTNAEKRPGGATTAYTIASTLLDNAPQASRPAVFLALLDLATAHTQLYDLIRYKFRTLPATLKGWGASPSQQQDIYVRVAELTSTQGVSDDGLSTADYLLKAISVDGDVSAELAKRAINALVSEPGRFTFEPVLVSRGVQAVRSQIEEHVRLLEVLATGTYAADKAYLEQNAAFLQSNGIDATELARKLRLLTVATISAQQDSRRLRYSTVAEALEVEESDVERWLIGAIQAGLVEGKLSQPSQTFVVHRALQRDFDVAQWDEIEAKIQSLRESLAGVLAVVDNVKADVNGVQLNPANDDADADADDIADASSNQIDGSNAVDSDFGSDYDQDAD